MTRDVTTGDTITYVNTRTQRGSGGVVEMPFSVRVHDVRDGGAVVVVEHEYVDPDGVSMYTERELDRDEFTRCSNCGRLMYYPTRGTNRYADECPGDCRGDAGC